MDTVTAPEGVTKTEATAAFLAGRAGGDGTLTAADCPYPEGDPRRYHWLTGWRTVAVR